MICDPDIFHNEPFSHQVQPGVYPVFVWWHREKESIIAAEIKISSKRPIHWEMATKPGQKVNELEKGYIFGCPIDSGVCCFADAEAINKMAVMEFELEKNFKRIL